MKYIYVLKMKRATALSDKPCNWRSVNEAKEHAKCLEMKGQKLVIRLYPERKIERH